MKVHLKQIPQGEALHLEGEEDPAALELASAGAEPVGPLRYSLDVGLSDGGLFATGWLLQRVRMMCVSCLESFEKEIVSDPFALQKELEGNESVDLTEEVREDIHLLLPAHPRCDSGGDKTCPAHFSAGSEHSFSSVEKAAPEVIWAALDQLKTPPSDGSP